MLKGEAARERALHKTFPWKRSSEGAGQPGLLRSRAWATSATSAQHARRIQKVPRSGKSSTSVLVKAGERQPRIHDSKNKNKNTTFFFLIGSGQGSE